MLVAIELILNSGYPFDFRPERAIRGEGLESGIHRRPICVVLADYRRQKAERRREVFVHRATLAAYSAIVHVHKDIGACLEFGHALQPSIDVVGSSAAARHDLHWHASLLHAEEGFQWRLHHST